MRDNQPYFSLVIVLISILCGTLGIILVCFGTIAVPTSIFAEDQINFFGGNDAQAALTAGLAALVIGLIFVAVPAYFLLNLITKRSEERVIDKYKAFQDEEEQNPPSFY